MKKINKIFSTLFGIVFIASIILMGLCAWWLYKNPVNDVSRVFKSGPNTAISAKPANYNGVTYDASANDIQSAAQIKKYQNEKSMPLYVRGYISIPWAGIHQQINEGSSARVLAVGAGTTKPNENMDKYGNYSIASHNQADWYWGKSFGELQPRSTDGRDAYTTDGKNIYTYRLISKTVMPKAKSMDYTEDDFTTHQLSDLIGQFGMVKKQANSINNLPTNETDQDPKTQQVPDDPNKPQYNYSKLLTLYTCYELPPNWMTPRNRLVVRGVMTSKVKAKKAPDWQKALFPELFPENAQPQVPEQPKGNPVQNFLAPKLNNDPSYIYNMLWAAGIATVISIIGMTITDFFSKRLKNNSELKDSQIDSADDFE